MAQRLQKARRYNREKERLHLIGLAIGLISGAFVVFSGSGAGLRSRVERRAGRGIAGRGAVVAVYALLSWFAGLPLSYYSGYVVEHRYDLSNQNHRAWALDQLKGLGDRKSTRLNSSHYSRSRMPSSA